MHDLFAEAAAQNLTMGEGIAGGLSLTAITGAVVAGIVWLVKSLMARLDTKDAQIIAMAADADRKGREREIAFEAAINRIADKFVGELKEQRVEHRALNDKLFQVSKETVEAIGETRAALQAATAETKASIAAIYQRLDHMDRSPSMLHRTQTP